MGKGRIIHRSRDLILTNIDLEAFSRAILELFPAALFIDGGHLRRPEGLPTHASMADCGRFDLDVLVPPDGWQPEIVERHPSGIYELKNPPSQRFNLRRPRLEWPSRRSPDAKWAFDPPTIDPGPIVASYYPDDAEMKAFVAAVWRILKKLTTNCFKVEYPHLGIVYNQGCGYAYWAGHDALRWCARKRARMLAGCFRPRDDWEFPDLPWYEGLGESDDENPV